MDRCIPRSETEVYRYRRLRYTEVGRLLYLRLRPRYRAARFHVLCQEDMKHLRPCGRAVVRHGMTLTHGPVGPWASVITPDNTNRMPADDTQGIN